MEPCSEPKTENPIDPIERGPDSKASKQAEPLVTEYPMGFKSNCSNIRSTIEATKVCTLTLKVHYEFTEKESYIGQHGEMQANIQLAYRHLEDARMRLGKAIQAYDGGKSCYSD